MNFSQRMGITPVQKTIQVESIDNELKNSLWNFLTNLYWKTFKNRIRPGEIKDSNLENLFTVIWINYFKQRIDSIPTYYLDEKGCLEFISNYFFTADWNEIYDFVEFISSAEPNYMKQQYCIDGCNSILERENSAYRFIDGKITPINSKDEVEEIENALIKSQSYYGVTNHLSAAVSLLSDRSNPDYSNSMKESISAVEGLCKTIITDEKATLGKALKALEEKKGIHPSLKIAFSSLYGYTSDSGGIRHASKLGDAAPTSADARFMLISCSAFINYVIASYENV